MALLGLAFKIIFEQKLKKNPCKWPVTLSYYVLHMIVFS